MGTDKILLNFVIAKNTRLMCEVISANNVLVFSLPGEKESITHIG